MNEDEENLHLEIHYSLILDLKGFGNAYQLLLEITLNR
jgi:hypothetical protein